MRSNRYLAVTVEFSHMPHKSAHRRCLRNNSSTPQKLPQILVMSSWFGISSEEQKKWLAGSPCRPTKRSSQFEMKRLLYPLRIGARRYAVNELPHPQLRVACGFWKT